jgi:long-chain fatty acid transport protein
MTKTIKLALVAAMAMGATSAFATNGDNLIGLGAKSRAMGGTGIAHFNGAESATANPALIVKSKGTSFAFGGTYFRPDVEIQADGPSVSNGMEAGSRTYESDAKHNVIPYVALTESFGNGWAVGASMYGSAGMGVDYRSKGPTAMGGVVNGAVGAGAPVFPPGGLN